MESLPKIIDFHGFVFKTFCGNIFSLMRKVRFSYFTGIYFRYRAFFNDFKQFIFVKILFSSKYDQKYVENVEKMVKNMKYCDTS